MPGVHKVLAIRILQACVDWWELALQKHFHGGQRFYKHNQVLMKQKGDESRDDKEGYCFNVDLRRPILWV
jgi:hypothetical protein